MNSDSTLRTNGNTSAEESAATDYCYEESDHQSRDPPPYESLDIEETSRPSPPPYQSTSPLGTSRLFDIPEAPPDYFSVVRSLQNARRDSNSTCVFVVKALQILCTTLGVLLLLFLLMSIPVVMLGIGAAYHGQCSVEPLIPIFLIVAGVCGVIKSAETLIKQMVVCCKLSKTISQHPKLKYLMLVWRVIDFVFNLALFAWFIAGSYWVFHVYAGLQAADFDEKLCHPVLYKCAFGIMICNYILLCTTCGCVCALSCCRKKHSTEEERPGRGSTSPECEASREEETGCSSPCTGDGVPLAASQVAIDVLPEEDTGSHQQSVDRTCSDTEL